MIRDFFTELCCLGIDFCLLENQTCYWIFHPLKPIAFHYLLIGEALFWQRWAIWSPSLTFWSSSPWSHWWNILHCSRFLPLSGQGCPWGRRVFLGLSWGILTDYLLAFLNINIGSRYCQRSFGRNYSKINFAPMKDILFIRAPSN